MSTDLADQADLAESLNQCRSELAAARERVEAVSEQQAKGDRALEQLDALARHVDAYLTRTEWSPSGVRGWVKRRLVRSVADADEAAAVRQLRGSRLFDGVWYLSTYPEIAETGLSPALHYLRHGAGEGKDPGPEFSTNHYLSRHPQIRRTGANPLINHLQTGQ